MCRNISYFNKQKEIKNIKSCKNCNHYKLIDDYEGTITDFCKLENCYTFDTECLEKNFLNFQFRFIKK
jgi:hypothetical protein